MDQLSICYVIKNEEMFLEKSLQSAAALDAKIRIHDTGSTDRSLKIIQDFKKTYADTFFDSVDWPNDFSEARNRLAEEVETPWILFIDGDEILDAQGVSEIKRAVSSNQADCFSLIQRNYTSDFKLQGAQLSFMTPEFLKPHEPLYFFDNWMERLYRKDSNLLYEGRVHESLLPSCRRHHKRHQKLEVLLHHAGRLKPLHERKLHYYLELSQKKLMEDLENPAAWIELAMTCNEIGQITQALHLMKKAASKFDKEPEVLRVAAESALRAEDFLAAEGWLRQRLAQGSKDSDTYARLSTALLYQGKFDESQTYAETALQVDSENFHAHLNLGIIFFEQKEFSKARPHLELAARLRPQDEFLKNALNKLPV